MRRAALVLTVLVLLAIAGAGALQLGGPFGGVSRAAAISAARDALEPMAEPSAGLQVSWAFAGPLAVFSDRPFASVAQWQQLVWTVRFRGTFKFPSCGPPPPAGETAHCPPPDRTATVVLDYRQAAVLPTPILIKIEA